MLNDEEIESYTRDKEKIFVSEYLKHFNAAKAAEKVGHSKANARQAGYRLLTNDYIKKAISDYVDNVLAGEKDALKVGVIDELKKIAFSDFSGVYDKENGFNIKDNGAIINSFSTGLDGKERIKLYDKMKALDTLTKYLSLIQEKTEHEHSGGIEIIFRDKETSA